MLNVQLGDSETIDITNEAMLELLNRAKTGGGQRWRSEALGDLGIACLCREIVSSLQKIVSQ